MAKTMQPKEDVVDEFFQLDKKVKESIEKIGYAELVYQYAYEWFDTREMSDIPKAVSSVRKSVRQNLGEVSAHFKYVVDGKCNNVMNGSKRLGALSSVSISNDGFYVTVSINGRRAYRVQTDFLEKWLSVSKKAEQDALIIELFGKKKAAIDESRRCAAEEEKCRERKRFMELRKKFVGG